MFPALEAVVGAMRACRSDLSVQERGCGAIWHLVAERNRTPLGQQEEDEEDELLLFAATECVLEAMRMYDAQMVQLFGCGAISALAAACKSSQRMQREEVVEAVLRAMHSFSADVWVYQTACNALGNLALHVQDRGFFSVLLICVHTFSA